MKLSALILTKNEEDMIEDCLKQLNFVDEIIILDQNSQDNTINLAKKYTGKIYKSDNYDFAKSRNMLAKYAKGEWLFYLDADERVNSITIDEIKSILKSPQYDAYYFPRKNYILGHAMKHGGWWPDYVPRLLKKSTLIAWYGEVHESPKIKGRFGYMKNPITHLTARSLNLMLSKSIKWAKIEAVLRFDAGQSKVTILKTSKAALLEFIYRYFVKKAFLDGTIGLIESIYQALHQIIVMAYLWEFQNKTQEIYEREIKK